MEEQSMQEDSSKSRWVLMFPFPFQGHLNPMLHLANLLHSKGFSIAIIHTHYRSPDPSSFPHLTFHFIDDGLFSSSVSLVEAKLDEPVLELPFVKVKDLPAESMHNLLASAVKDMRTSQGIICNTFEELESHALAIICKSLPIPVFPIAPLHIQSPSASESSINAQDKDSLAWLNTQAPKSVLYVSFGSLVAVNEAEFQEIAWGLANSKQPFLWLVRPGLVQGLEPSDPLTQPEGYIGAVGRRGQIVEWAPQQEVLGHSSVGGFWTHCGWNSTVDSICQGVPLIC